MTDPFVADNYFSQGNYPKALHMYLALHKKNPEVVEFNYRIGICYLKTFGHKVDAIPFLEFVTGHQKFENDTWSYLGQAYQYALRFDEAISAYATFKLKADKDAKIEADRRISQCINGKILTANPLNVTFSNAGREINSDYSDYYPFVTSDESMIVFTSRRKGNTGSTQLEMDGYYASDVYVSNSVRGNFQKAKGAGPLVNGNYDEQCTSLSSDGQLMTLYVDDIISAGDIYMTTYSKNAFEKIEKLVDNNKGEYLHINGGFETAGSFSPDGNSFFFASDRSNSNGGTDLYIVRKLPADFGWGEPINMGPVINTSYNEDFPFMAPDGKTLYFSSEGHNSMGGYDLFVTVYNSESKTWSVPRNIGFPVNSPGDDRSICFTENNRVAYISSDRPGGYGELDIWRIVFNEVQNKTFTIITGRIELPDTSIAKADVEMMVVMAGTGEDYGIYRPNPKTGHYVMALPPGKYALTINAPGCKLYSETLIVFDIGLQEEINKDIILKKESQ